MTPPVTAGPDAHRAAWPRTGSGCSRWRVLALCVVAATVAGALSDRAVSSEAAPAAATHALTPAAPPPAEQSRRAADKRPRTRAAHLEPGHQGRALAGHRRAARASGLPGQIAQENPAYVRGRKGWLFFTDYQVQNFSQALGRVTQTKNAAERLGQVHQEVAAHGREGRAASTASWCRRRTGRSTAEFLPTWAQKLRGTMSLQTPLKAHPELPWIDTRAALRKAAQKHDTYEPLNSHWTPYGGYVAWEAITYCLRTHGLEGIDVPDLKRVGIAKNLNEFATNGVPDGKPARTDPVYTKKHAKTVTGTSRTERRCRTCGRLRPTRCSCRCGRRPTADTDPTLLVAPRLHRQRPVAAVEPVVPHDDPVQPRLADGFTHPTWQPGRSTTRTSSCSS